jgi:hypothetical protein
MSNEMEIIMRRLASGLIVVGLLACQGNGARTLPSSRVGLRLTTAKVARQLSRQVLHVEIPFGLAESGVNGTGILLGFLQRLEIYRAVFVSDLSYALQMTYNGMTIECISKVRVDDGSREPEAPVGPKPDQDDEIEYTTTINPWRPPAIDAWVDDREMTCKQHARQVPARVPRYDNIYNAEIARSLYVDTGYALILRDIPVDNTAIVYYDECTYEPKRRYVHRYEHFIAAKFTPPDLDVIRRNYADLPLIAEPPLCHQIQVAPGQPLRQHIDADVHFPAVIVPDRENLHKPLPPVRQVGGS